jgi:predicted nuclease of predicted toxin-antitoxin system
LSLRFKLDENADPRWREPLEQAGHQVSTAAEESLNGTPDELVAETCRSLGLCLITADLDFAQVVNYPPAKYSGLIVLRHPHPTLAGMRDLVSQVASAVAQESPTGQLWIVEPGRIRAHWPLPSTEP